MAADKEKILIKNSKISKQSHIIEECGENGEVQYNCTSCRKTFRSRSQRYYHLNCNQLQSSAYQCEYCDKSFTRQTQWKYHIKSHISPINECPKCRKTFSNPLALKKHVALHEVELKSCTQCDKTFKKKISLDQHIAAQHYNQLEYGCAFCSKKYASKSSLQLHLQTHEGKRFECKFCGKLFQRNSILNLHLKRHYNKSGYTCAICHKNFSESGTLARHKKIHEETGPQYYCKLCDKNIIRKDNMTRHLTTIHPEEDFDKIVKIITPSIKLQQTAEPNLHNSKEDNATQSSNHILVIENKLLYKTSEEKEYRNNLSNMCKTKNNTVEYPITNQIKVITEVPAYKHEACAQNIKINKQCSKANLQHQEDSLEFKNHEAYCQNSIRIYDKNTQFVDHTQTDPTKFCEQSDNKELNKTQEYFHTYKSELKTTETAIINRQQTFSSVIKSVGNVKKNLTPHIVTPDKPVTHVSLEYKHKKYCRNHYNIDLYRKILGCHEDDYNEEAKEEKLDDTRKSPTPVHWRKCFKNNYETLES